LPCRRDDISRGIPADGCDSRSLARIRADGEPAVQEKPKVSDTKQNQYKENGNDTEFNNCLGGLVAATQAAVVGSVTHRTHHGSFGVQLTNH
jgi:hypothetical protein